MGRALSAVEPFLKAGKNPYLVHVGSGLSTMGDNRDDVLAKRIPEGTRYVGVGVGKHWARSFMKLAAERTDGYFTQINPDEPIAWRAFELFSTLCTPRLLNAKVVDGAEKAVFLTDNNSVSQGEELCAITRVDKELPESVVVSGTINGKPFRETVPVKNVAAKADYLPRTWAKLEIDRLLAEDAAANKAKIVALSKAMYVMTPYTSLLVLENEQMYQQYGVDRGRNDHWAMYECPERIAIVTEPVQQPDERPKIQQPDNKPKTSQLTAEEQRLQQFWRDYYGAMQIDHTDWVKYYNNHGYQINNGNGGYGPYGMPGGYGGGGYGGGAPPTGYAPVIVTPGISWAVPPQPLPDTPLSNGFYGGPLGSGGITPTPTTVGKGVNPYSYPYTSAPVVGGSTVTTGSAKPAPVAVPIQVPAGARPITPAGTPTTVTAGARTPPAGTPTPVTAGAKAGTPLGTPTTVTGAKPPTPAATTPPVTAGAKPPTPVVTGLMPTPAATGAPVLKPATAMPLANLQQDGRINYAPVIVTPGMQWAVPPTPPNGGLSAQNVPNQGWSYYPTLTSYLYSLSALLAARHGLVHAQLRRAQQQMLSRFPPPM